MSVSKTSQRTVLASLSTGMATAFLPQYSQAAIVTVGGDGGIGSVTLRNIGDSTNLGGVLARNLYLSMSGAAQYLMGALPNNLFKAVRSSISYTGAAPGAGRWSFILGSNPTNGAIFNSSDNWVPGHFGVNGVNGGNAVWGWLHVDLAGAGNDIDPTIISFTYDDAAIDTTAFTKPVGGFSVTAVPVPPALGLFAIGLGAMGVLNRRRQLKAQAEA